MTTFPTFLQAFHAASFFQDLLNAAVFSAIMFGACALLAEDRSKDKLCTYLVTAVCTGVVVWILSMCDWLFIGQWFGMLLLVLWVVEKLLDFSLLRSAIVTAAVLTCYYLYQLLY